MDVHGISASKINEVRQILPKKVLPSSDKIKAGIASLNQQITEVLGLYSGPNHAGVNAKKALVWLIQNGLIPDERRIGLLWSGDGRQTGRKMRSVQIGVTWEACHGPGHGLCAYVMVIVGLNGRGLWSWS